MGKDHMMRSHVGVRDQSWNLSVRSNATVCYRDENIHLYIVSEAPNGIIGLEMESVLRFRTVGKLLNLGWVSR